MTPREQLIEIGKAHGWGWQTKLAPSFGWSTRTMRRKVAGKSAIDKTEADAIRARWNEIYQPKKSRNKPGPNPKPQSKESTLCQFIK